MHLELLKGSHPTGTWEVVFLQGTWTTKQRTTTTWQVRRWLISVSVLEQGAGLHNFRSSCRNCPRPGRLLFFHSVSCVVACKFHRSPPNHRPLIPTQACALFEPDGEGLWTGLMRRHPSSCRIRSLNLRPCFLRRCGSGSSCACRRCACRRCARRRCARR